MSTKVINPIISLAMSKVFLFDANISNDEYDAKIRDGGLFADSEYWKNPTQHTFAFTKVLEAQNFMFWILACLADTPEFSFDFRKETITVSTKGYQAW